MTDKYPGQRGQFIAPEAKTMPNGEVRVPTRFPDGTAFIRTWAAPEPVWQNAHHHKGLEEIYIVQTGKVMVVTCDVDGKNIKNICHHLLTSMSPPLVLVPGVNHNVFSAYGAIFDVVKRGAPEGNSEKKGNDWWASPPAFDEWTKSQSPEDVFKRSGCIPSLS